MSVMNDSSIQTQIYRHLDTTSIAIATPKFKVKVIAEIMLPSLLDNSAHA